jgi:hypothetical protein
MDGTVSSVPAFLRMPLDLLEYAPLCCEIGLCCLFDSL